MLLPLILVAIDAVAVQGLRVVTTAAQPKVLNFQVHPASIVVVFVVGVFVADEVVANGEMEKHDQTPVEQTKHFEGELIPLGRQSQQEGAVEDQYFHHHLHRRPVRTAFFFIYFRV